MRLEVPTRRMHYILFIFPVCSSSPSNSALENALKKHSSGTTSAAFSGKGQSLGGSSAAPPPSRNDGLEAPLVNIDPQVKKLLYFFGAYLLFWYLSR
jgi:thioredoxin 1